MSKLRAADFENMSIEQLMELSADQVQKLTNLILPLGIYSGTVQEWELPTPDDNNFKVAIANVVPQELQNEEEAEGLEIPEDYSLTQRYNTGMGFQALVTHWEPLMQSAFEGLTGNMIANSAGTEILFEVTHRKVQNPSTKEVRTYVQVANVNAA